jgi:hypothetical protein
MKRALAYFLLLIYFTASTGFVINRHYCMDKLDAVQFGSSQSDTCGKCGMHQGENNCCFDDVQVLKLNTSHLVSQIVVPDFFLPVLTSFTTAFLLSPLVNMDGENNTSITPGPPLITDQKVYLENCVFRI